MVKLERGRQLRAAEDQRLGAAREQMLTGRAERGDVVRQVAGLDAVVDDGVRSSTPLCSKMRW